MSLIKLENINKYYNCGNGVVKALSNINLSVEKGEFIAISGTSGSGKSTLMNILGCLDISTCGNYFLDKMKIASLSENELSRIRNQEIGFIFQSFNLINSLTAEANVELPLRYRKIGKKQRKELVQEAMKKVSMNHRMSHKPTEMSGGQQQRTAIARAIACSPPIILADEPTGNLDSVSTAEVMKILYDLNDSGKTIIIITHDPKIAMQAKRVVTISDGEIISDVYN